MPLPQDFELLFRGGDPSFGIGCQALALLQYISYKEIEGIVPPEVCHTFPMKMEGYIGVTYMFKREDDPTLPWLLIYIGDSANDQIVVKQKTARALQDPSIGPTHYDFNGATTEYFVEGDIVGAYTTFAQALLVFML